LFGQKILHNFTPLYDVKIGVKLERIFEMIKKGFKGNGRKESRSIKAGVAGRTCEIV
jgi:hypothetical protein